MTSRLLIEQVDNYCVIQAQIPAWSMAFSYLTIGIVGIYLVIRNRKKKR